MVRPGYFEWRWREYKMQLHWGWLIFGAVALLLAIWLFARHSNQDYIGLAGTSLETLQKLFKRRTRIEKKREQACRRILERIYQRPFPSVRPSFMRYPSTGRNLELDCYNDGLRLALEYQGQQHYKYTPMFHKSPDDLVRQQEHDRFKVQRCREVGINLIVVPYSISDNELEPFIRARLPKNLGI